MKAASQNNLRFVFSDAPPVMLYSFIEQTLQPGPAVSLKCSAGIVFYLRSNFFPFLNFLLFCIFCFGSRKSDTASIMDFGWVSTTIEWQVCVKKCICRRWKWNTKKIYNNWCSRAQRFSLVFGDLDTARRKIKEYVFMHHEVYYCGIKIPSYDLTFFVSTNFPKAWRYVQIFIMDAILMVLQKICTTLRLMKYNRVN